MTFEQDRSQCLDKLIWATDRLQIETDNDKINKIAELIVQTMTGPWRYFHTPEHIFEVGGSEDAIEVLSALFHDLVYVQVDRSVNFNLTYYISPFVKEVRGQLYVRGRSELDPDLMLDIIMSVFGFSPEQALSPMAGQNEFLSALVGAKVLESFVPLKLIVQIVACIEATIPFRSKDSEGLSSCDRLYMRLLETSRQFNIDLSEEEIRETVKKSVRLANRDVGSFANPSAARFLDGTWSLLPETNHNLKESTSYTVHAYRTALQKMEGFMHFLKPEAIFHQFDNEPDPATFLSLIGRSAKNMEVGRLYLGCKIFTIAFLEALSLRLGRDIPLSAMMGEMPSDEYPVSKLVDFLPPVSNPYPPNTAIESAVLDLLEKGRLKSSSYDLKNSPLATFFAKSMGFDEIRYQRARAKEFFTDKISAEDFIAGCDRQVTEGVTEGILRLFDSRKTALSGARKFVLSNVC